jgi:mRNA interferase RelE/StbE
MTKIGHNMNNGYRILYRRAAAMYLRRLPARERTRILEAVEALSEGTRDRVLDVKKLRNRPGYRMRVGRFRILFERNDEQSVIRVLVIRPRGDVYKG